MIRYKIGIVGQGYVGKAISSFFSDKNVDLFTYDKFVSDTSNCSSLSKLVELSEIIFICLPTPMKKNGECYTGIVEEVVSDINDYTTKNKILVLKSTVPPGTSDKLNHDNNNISLIFNPEFLTEANFIEDFLNQKNIIIGGEEKHLSQVEELYQTFFPNVSIRKTNAINAEMTKYILNTFLATKVSFANEIKILCDRIGADYDRIIELVCTDNRAGNSHWSVPGPDGKIGFGGSCFPKDINGLLMFAESLGIEMEIIKSAIDVNSKLRPEKDWEKLKNRSVIDI